MRHSQYRFLIIAGIFGLVCQLGIGTASAWERPPVKVNTVFQFKVEVKVGPEIKPPTAPWYTYFPVDERMVPSMQLTPYPTWPAPGQMPTPPTPKATGNPGYAPTAVATQYWPPTYANSSNVQPVGFVPASAPSYWYQGR